jgi:hypothetical protein
MTEGETEDDPSLFATAMIAEALAACDDRRARTMLEAAAQNLASHMEALGVWRHWSSEHPQFKALPLDADDTACASIVLRLAGTPFPDNRPLLRGNVDACGRFFTWILLRPRRRLPSAGLLRIGLRRGAHPVHARMFWRATSAEPDDVDGIVNAHVLAYLGDGPHAAAVVRYLAEVIEHGAEATCDKWYRSPFLLYAALGRCAAAGVRGIADLAPAVGERIEAAASADGRVGDGHLDTAWAVRALAELGLASPAREKGVAFLEVAQSADGSWPAAPVYFGGPAHHPDVPCWGSHALSTGICAGALARARL